MSHNIEQKTDNAADASVFVVGDPAWHNLGKVVKNALTSTEALKQANLDFTVKTTPSKFTIGKKQVVVPGKYAVYRTDTEAGLGVVGSDYTPLQNVDAFKFFDTLVGEGQAIYHTGGVLNDGRRVWIMAKFPDSIVLHGEDIVDQYCLLTNSHDGSSSVTACLTSVRVVCNNTLSMALRSTKTKINVRHTTNVVKNIEQAHELLGLYNTAKIELTEIYESLVAKKVNTAFVDQYLNTLYPKKEETKVRTNGDNIREGILEAFEGGLGSELVTAHGTAFGLYNAVSHYTNHTKSYDNADQKLNSIWFGGAKKLEDRAFDLILDMCQN